MSQVCQVTGKRPLVGMNVSHSHTRTKKRSLPNLQRKRFWLESENRWVRLRVSAAGIRVIDQRGIDKVIADIRARGEKV
ncbi:MAG: 50S ribosomal protein L28 [Nannocystaceae bacterium]